MRIAPGASIAIHTKPHHPQAAGLAQELALWLQQRGYQPQINGDPENEDSAVAGLGLWGPQAGASTSGARGEAALGPAPIKAARGFAALGPAPVKPLKPLSPSRTRRR